MENMAVKGFTEHFSSKMEVHQINFAVNFSLGDGGFLQDKCPDNDTDCWDAFRVQYICNGILLPILSIFGILGNALTMVVLWRREMHSSTILFMRGLVLTDTGIIIGACIAITPHSLAMFHPELKYFMDVIYPNIYTPIYFIVMTIQQCNVWITVSTSVERYISICHPFKAPKIISKKKTKISLVVITLVSIIYNIPRCLAFKVKSGCNGKQDDCFMIVITEFGESSFYHFYLLYLYAFVIYVIPLCTLLVLNVLIINELMRMRRRRAGLNIQEDNEANLSLVLVLIVVVFILCQTPGLLAQFDTLFDRYSIIKWLAVSNFLFVTNSSVNFLIYTAVGRKFRKLLKKFFCRVIRGASFSEISKASTTRRGTVGGYELNNASVNYSEETHIENSEKMRLNG